MGQARQRRLAKAAGKPWPEDLPKPAGPHAGQYLGNDGEWHRQAVRAEIEKLARSCMDEISEAGAAHSLLYFDTWLGLRGGFGKD
jgi:hypothetical protein